MEVKVKNQDLGLIIGQLNALQKEKITLGVKNSIQKLVKTLTKDFEPFNKLVVELLEKLEVKPEKGNYKAPDGFFENLEYKEIAEQKNTIIFDPIDFNKIADLETQVVYNFELLSPFFENFE
jgi:hypothetical protein